MFKAVFEEHVTFQRNLQLVYQILENNELRDLFDTIRNLTMPVRTIKYKTSEINLNVYEISEINYKKVRNIRRLYSSELKEKGNFRNIINDNTSQEKINKILLYYKSNNYNLFEEYNIIPEDAFDTGTNTNGSIWTNTNGFEWTNTNGFEWTNTNGSEWTNTNGFEWTKIKNGTVKIWDHKIDAFKYTTNLFEFKLIKQENFLNWKLHGKCFEFFGNEVQETNYVNGKLHGPQKIIWSYSDKLIKEENYNNGVKHGPYKIYNYETKIITVEGNYFNGKQHGKYINRTDDGFEYYQINYVNSRRSGLEVRYHAKTKKIISEKNYKRNHLHGQVKTYNEEGQVTVKMYTHGNIIKNKLA